MFVNEKGVLLFEKSDVFFTKWCFICVFFWKIGLWLLKTFSHWTSHCISTDYIVITAHKCSLRRLCFYRCVSVHGGGVLSQHALQVVSQHALQQGGLLQGGVWSRGCLVGGSPPGQSPWGVLLLGVWTSVVAFWFGGLLLKVAFCCGLLVWSFCWRWPSVVDFWFGPSAEGGLLLWTSVMDFWFGTFCWRGPSGMVFWRGAKRPHQKATTPEGHHTRRPPHQKATTPEGHHRGGAWWRPPPDGYCCGRYASYWNGFLLCMKWNENVSNVQKYELNR